MRTRLAGLILATTAIRVAFAAATGLGVDESYMVATGRIVSLGYFDHPPLAWWLSWGAAHLTGSETAVVVRLPFILLFALSTWLMFKLGEAVADARAGFWAAVLLNLSPVFGVTTGSWVLPDGPLDCALLGAALCLARALPATGGRALAWWIGTGLCAGLALFSKYSAVLTIGGAFLYLLTSPLHRPWLRRAGPWLAGIVALLVFAPVVAWNARHGWASFAFQGERATGLHLRPLAPVTTLLGEALFVLPWIWAPMMLLFVRAVRAGPRQWRSWLLVCLGAPPIVVFALIAGWSGQRVLFHWAAPGYLMLFPLLGAWVAERLSRGWLRHTLIGTALLTVTVLAVISTQLRLDWLGSVIGVLARQDPTIEGINWNSLRQTLRAREQLPDGMLVGVPNWRDAGKVAYALGPRVTVICLNQDSRQFGFTHPAAAFVGRPILVLIPEHADRELSRLLPHLAGVTVLAPAPIALHGRVLRWVAVYYADRLAAWP